MRLIADSGSTKTDWRLLDDENNIHQAKSIGLNPYFVDEKVIIDAVTTGSMQVFPSSEIEEVIFYGSGCGSESMKSKMKGALQQVFTAAEISIEHDLLGAARALCGKQPGISCILGTGMNSCLYDGNTIVENLPSLGYILGDEGSGAHLGKRLLAEYHLGVVPDSVATSLEKRLEGGLDVMLQKVYSEPFPNRYLASFSKFIYQKISDPYCTQLVKSCFTELYAKYLSRYTGFPDKPVHFCGSVAYYFSAILKDVAEAHDSYIGSIIESPIAGLTLYHLDE
jgi:glucosamine kinase